MKIRDLPRVSGVFRKDESGAAIIWVTLMIPVIFGLLVLAIDGARVMNLKSDLQQIADAAALAGAKRLDGSENSIENAKADALNYLSNQPRWSDVAASGSQIAQVDVFDVIPTATTTPLTNTQDDRAVYVRVTTVNRSLNASFAKFFSVGRVSSNATAIAKTSYSICRPIQSFICNEWEASNPNKGTAQNWPANVTRGKMYILAGGTGSAEGNWGLIDPTLGGGGSAPKSLADFWAKDSLGTCEIKTINDATKAQEPLTGNLAQHAVDGMNVRFDVPYDGKTAAPVTLDGYKKGGSCSAKPDSATPNDGSLSFKQTNESFSSYQSYCNGTTKGSCPLPRDRSLPNIKTGSWTNIPSGSGADPADLQAYWKNQHGTEPFPTTAAGTPVTTRYEIYKAEVAKANAGVNSYFRNTISSPLVENYGPVCAPASTDPERRLINVAILDCNYLKAKGSSWDIPLTTLTAQFFLTEPATDDWNVSGSLSSSQKGRMHAEYVTSYTINQEGGSVFQVVELVK